jgi:cysteinyl-tRNA synthetase
MDDDFNTPAALAHFQHLRGEVNRLLATGLSGAAAAAARQTFRTYGHVLGLFQLPVGEWEFKELEFRVGASGATGQARLSDAEVERLLTERNEARRRKNFRQADEIRALLAAHSITIEDRPDGTSRWKR